MAQPADYHPIHFDINWWPLIKDTVVATFWIGWLFLKILWPYLLILALVYFLKIYGPILTDRWIARKRFAVGKNWLSDRDRIRWLRGMSPREFEEYITELFLKLGFKTKTVGKPFDGGVDVIAEKDGIAHYIQCKKYAAPEVGVTAVREFYGAIADHLADGKGYFITTNKFTLEAERYASDKPIELVDQFKLVKYIKMAEETAQKQKI